MCGRYTLTRPEQLALRFDAILDGTDRTEATYNITPTTQVPVVVEEADRRHVRFMTWGFRPTWARADDRRPTPINARAETLRERPYFQRSLARGRCLIPASGLYEWRARGDGRSKQPYYIQRPDGDLFAFAGLYTVGSAGSASTCAIITTTPNRVIEPIHDRMPAILLPDDETLWLDPNITDPEPALQCLRPYPDDGLVAYAVASLVSSPRNSGPALIQRLAPA